jgi:hypothetical protein
MVELLHDTRLFLQNLDFTLLIAATIITRTIIKKKIYLNTFISQ